MNSKLHFFDTLLNPLKIRKSKTSKCIKYYFISSIKKKTVIGIGQKNLSLDKYNLRRQRMNLLSKSFND